MHTTEVYIDIPCDDHLDHTSKIGSMKFRMNEDLVRIYSGKPEITCTAVGTENLTTARNTIVYEMEDITVKKRWPLPNGSFEWFAKMDIVTLKRMNIQVTHCVRVEIDVHLDAGPKTTIIWKLSGDDDRQQERVMSLIQKLAPESYDKYVERIGELRLAPVWKERS